jgi:hypothetical protein
LARLTDFQKLISVRGLDKTVSKELAKEGSARFSTLGLVIFPALRSAPRREGIGRLLKYLVLLEIYPEDVTTLLAKFCPSRRLSWGAGVESQASLGKFIIFG